MNTGIRRDGGLAAGLAHLAANGPTQHVEMRGILADRLSSKEADYYAGVQLRRLETLGLVAIKVWLTPKGLDEVRRLHLAPRIEGVPA